MLQIGNGRRTTVCIDWSFSRLLVQYLSNLHDLTTDFISANGTDPVASSKADNELRAFPRRDFVIIAYEQGDVLIQAAADNLHGMYRSLTEPALTIAPWVCLRALMEEAALASWLLDCKINVRERVKRCLALRFEDQTRQVTLSKMTNEMKALEGAKKSIGNH